MATFISYSRANSDFAVQLTKDLSVARYHILRERSIAPEEARCILIVVSTESIQSQDVRDQSQIVKERSQDVEGDIRDAIDSGKKIVLIIREPYELSPTLQRFPLVDFTKQPYLDALQEVKRELDKSGCGPELEPEPGKPKPEPKPGKQESEPTPVKPGPVKQESKPTLVKPEPIDGKKNDDDKDGKGDKDKKDDDDKDDKGDKDKKDDDDKDDKGDKDKKDD